VDELARRPDSEKLFGFAAADFAISRALPQPPGNVARHLHCQPHALLTELAAYEAELGNCAGAGARDAAALEQTFTLARAARQAWLDRIESKPWITR